MKKKIKFERGGGGEWKQRWFGVEGIPPLKVHLFDPFCWEVQGGGEKR